MHEFVVAKESASPGCSRRDLLRGVALGWISWFLPAAFAAPAAPDTTAFNALSAMLTGRKVDDSARSHRLFDALVADNTHFASDVAALLDLMHTRNVPVAQLQTLLDSEKSPLAPLPRAVVSAWYLGIVGSGKTARCLDFEMAMNAQVVGDVLKPPTYCYGGYGSWAAKPV